MRLEGDELRCPELLSLLEPRFEVGNGLRSQGLDAHARIESRMRLLDQPVRLQGPKMSAQRRWIESNGLGDFACPPRPVPQQLDDPAAVGVGQRHEGAVEFGSSPQTQPSILSPLARSASSRVT